MSGRKRIDTFKRDNLLVDIIYQHKGKENAIGTQQLVHALGERGYEVQADHVHTIVKKVTLDRHVPICSHGHSGYYWGRANKIYKLQLTICKIRYADCKRVLIF